MARLSLSHSRFDADDPSPANIDASRFRLGLTHYVADGIAATIDLPFGTLRSQDAQGSLERLDGPGDLAIGGSVDFGRFWRPRPFIPSFRAAVSLGMPTGRTSPPSDAVAPQLLSIGSGAFGMTWNADATSRLHRRFALQLSGIFWHPLSRNSRDILFGTRVDGRLAAHVYPTDILGLSVGTSVWSRQTSDEASNGTLVNSGGNGVKAQLSAAVRIGERFTLGATGELPLVQDVGEQLVEQSYRVGLTMTLNLYVPGEAKAHAHDEGDDEDGHHHADAPDHDHEGEHAAEPEDEHAHDHADEHAPGAQTAVLTATTGDVADLATGGASFDLQSAGVPGKITVIDFWAEWCEPCKDLDVRLRQFAAEHPDFAVRRVEVVDPASDAVSEHLDAKTVLPTIWFVDRKGHVLEKHNGVTPDAVMARLRSMARSAEELGARSSSPEPGRLK